MNKICAVIFSTTHISKQEFSEIISQMYIDLHLKYASFVSDFNET